MGWYTTSAMSSFPFSTESVGSVCSHFRTSVEHGLSEAEAAARLVTNGKNIIEATSVSWQYILIRQFASPFIYLLLGAGSLALALGEFIDATLIVIFLLVNAALGFIQEYRSQKTAEYLRRFVAPTAHVVRGGKRLIVQSETLVPGDIVYLETGDRVPADMRIVFEHNLTVDESVLTGESVPVSKSAESVKKNGLPATGVFSGTTVVAGGGIGVVLRTGKMTAVGEVSELVATTDHKSSFEGGIAQFSKFILKLVLGTLVFVLTVNLILKGNSVDIGDLILFSIALAVSVIPEALPVVTTFSLSRGAHELAERKVIVKRLSAIEDLGGIEVLCTDKTGTITENVLTIEGFSPHTETRFLESAVLASARRFGKHPLEPFDAALLNALEEKTRKGDLQSKSGTRLIDVPFNPETRLNAVLVGSTGTAGRVIIRGALSAVLSRSTLTTEEKKKELRFASEAGKSGKRILAVAERRVTNTDELKGSDSDITKGTFTYLGAAAFVDPIKPTTKHAVLAAKRLGVSIKMVTGDAPEVAVSVASEIGLITKDTDVVTGEMFEKMSHPERMSAVLKNNVFARVTPKQKYEIVSSLREKKTVGFLGEGINDAPALKAATVSLVVQSASDIAREAADIILMKRSLNVIIDGIEQGRAVFSNTTKYIRTTLSSNFGNFYAVAVVSLFIDFLPMLPIQILLLNLLSDVPLIAIATDHVGARDLERPSRYNIREIVWVATILGIVSTVFDFILFSLFYREGAGILQTNWFLGSLLTELIFVFSVRSLLPFYRAGFPSRPLVLLTLGAAVGGIILPFTVFGQSLFHFVAPTGVHMIIIILVTLAYFAATEIIKSLLRRGDDSVQKGELRLLQRIV